MTTLDGEPHGPLTALAENLWIVDGIIAMPPGPLPRRMTVARLADGSLVIFSAIRLSETEFGRLEQLGPPRYLVVPNGFHRHDAAAFKARYPQLRVVTPEAARAMVEEVVPVDATTDIFADPTVRFLTVPGTGDRESALLVTSAGGTTLVLNDLVGNVRDSRGLMKLVLTLMGFAGRRPQVPRMFARRVVTDRHAVATQFREWAALPGLERIIVSHGAMIDGDARGELLRLADSLG